MLLTKHLVLGYKFHVVENELGKFGTTFLYFKVSIVVSFLSFTIFTSPYLENSRLSKLEGRKTVRYLNI